MHSCVWYIFVPDEKHSLTEVLLLLLVVVVVVLPRSWGKWVMKQSKSGCHSEWKSCLHLVLTYIHNHVMAPFLVVSAAFASSQFLLTHSQNSREFQVMMMVMLQSPGFCFPLPQSCHGREIYRVDRAGQAVFLNVKMCGSQVAARIAHDTSATILWSTMHQLGLYLIW